MIARFARTLVRLEEHVFVEMREAIEFGRFGVRTVFDRDLDRHQRHGVVFDDDDLQPVLELGHLPLRLGERGRGDGE